MSYLNDKDVEIDGEPVPASRNFFGDQVSSIAPSKHSINPTYDSGIDSYLSTVSEANVERTRTCGQFDHDRRPVQCTDDVVNANYDLPKASEVLDKLSTLSISEKDEGICSLSISSLGSERTSLVQEEPIEIDLHEIDEDGDTIIHVAILNKKTELAVVLIELAEDIVCLNVQNVLRQTPLHLAVLLGDDDVIKCLLARHVDVTLRDHQGNSPLHLACRLGDQDSTQRIVASFGNDLKSRKQYFTMKNRDGLTCLHVASQQKEYMIMGHLFAKGADVNIGDAKSGRTVLHYAVEMKDLETVALLLTHTDIDVDCRTFKGDTPLVMAYWRNYKSILKKLKSKGAYFSYDIVEDSDDEYST